MFPSSIRPRSRQSRLSEVSEPLEARVLLSNIVWNNRGTAANDSDGFGAEYGANAETARAIVDEAIADWETVVADFNYNNVGMPGYAAQENTFQLNLMATAFSQSGLNGMSSITNIDLDGKPLAANIQIDDNAGGQGWFFDTTPGEHSEFTNILSPYDGFFFTDKGVDLYRTVAHEIGHALGIAYMPGLAINNFLTPAGTDSIDGVSNLHTFTGPTITTTITENGGGHLFENAAPNDLLNPGRSIFSLGAVQRRLISDTTASVLQDAYGYTVTMPNVHESMFARLDASTGVVTVTGVTGATTNDNVRIRSYGSMMRIDINGQTDYFPISQISSINITTFVGSDTIVVESTKVPVTIDGGANLDSITIGNTSSGLEAIDAPVTVTGDGSDALAIDDRAAGSTRFYTLTGNSFDRTAAATINFSAMGTFSFLLGSASDYFTVQSTPTAIAITIDGGSGSDHLTGPEAASLFEVTSANQGMLNDIDFLSIEHLAGGNLDDQFVLHNGASLSGGIDGRGGWDRLDLSSLGQTVTANLEAGTITAVAGGIEGLEDFRGNNTGGDTLIGWNTATEFGVDNWGQGYLFSGSRVATYRGFENLKGGTSADIFHFFDNGGLSGQIDGGDGGGDVISYENVDDTINVNLQQKTASRLLGGWTRVNGFIGGTTGDDTLIGPAQSTSWALGGENKGSLYNYTVGAIDFVDFEHLAAGNGNDWFTLEPGFELDGTLDGGGGLNTLDYRAYRKEAIFVDLEHDQASHIGWVSDIRRVYGGELDDILIGSDGDDILNGHHGNDLLIGRDGHDDLFGGEGDDAIFGGFGNDAMNGQNGHNLIVAGVTTYEQASSNDGMLRPLIAIHDVWRNQKLTFAERVSKIENGFWSPSKQFVQLNQNTIQDDGAYEGKLIGGKDADWFWLFKGDNVFDLEQQDVVN